MEQCKAVLLSQTVLANRTGSQSLASPHPYPIGVSQLSVDGISDIRIRPCRPLSLRPILESADVFIRQMLESACTKSLLIDRVHPKVLPRRWGIGGCSPYPTSGRRATEAATDEDRAPGGQTDKRLKKCRLGRSPSESLCESCTPVPSLRS